MSRLVLALSVALALVPSLSAANNWPPPDGDSVNLKDPANWPNDPGYAGQWNYWSFIGNGATNVRPGETASGISVDRAWQKTTGDRRILITVLDSGIRWNSPDLVNKFYLNPGELPVPQGCGTAPAGHDPHDVNGDGIFNVQDYTTATGHELPDAAKICDSFVVESDDFAMAVLYAVDRGTDVIQEALGSINNTSFTQRALDYAYENGVVVV